MFVYFLKRIYFNQDYAEFISGCKLACGKAMKSVGEGRIRRMRCLDPAHFKILFDMIRITRLSAVEQYTVNESEEHRCSYRYVS